MKLSKYYLTLHEEAFNYISSKKVARQSDIIEILKAIGFDKSDREHLYSFILDLKGNVIGFEEVSSGTQSLAPCHPREYYKVAVYANAAATIMVHNHPSGDTEPSIEDIALTKRIAECGRLLGIMLLDSIVIGSTGEYSSVIDLI